MPISRSHGRSGPENFRPDELGTPPPKTGETVPERDGETGRFKPGNRAARRRRLKQAAGRLGAMDPDKCESWLRPFVVEAKAHAAKLLADIEYQTEELSAVVVELAEARAMRAALMRLGSEGDLEARQEARHWLREVRQHAIALRGLINQEHAARTLGRRGPEEPSTCLVQQPDGSFAPFTGRAPVGSIVRSPAMLALVGRNLDGTPTDEAIVLEARTMTPIDDDVPAAVGEPEINAAAPKGEPS